MADQGMFGSPVGDIAFDQNQLTQAKTQETLGDVAMQPAKRRLIEAQAGKLEHDAQFEKLMAQSLGTLGGQPGGKPMSMADSFDNLARIAVGSGFVTKAEDLAKTSALLRTREAAQLKSNVDTKLGALKVVRDNAELTSQLLGGVNDPESWARANALYTFQTGQPSPFSNMTYSPELVERLNQAALSAKERADLEEKKLTRTATAEYRRSRLDQINEQNDLRRQRIEQAAAREERLAKGGGGKGVSAPAKSETDQAVRLIKKDFDGLEAADMNDAAFSIASDARALRRSNPALNPAMALQQAYAAAKEAGDFAVLPRKALGMDVPGTSKPVYQGRGKTATLPAPVPTDKGVLAKGKFYINPAGAVAQWNGKAFVPVSRPLSSDNSRPDTEAGDDEEGDDD